MSTHPPSLTAKQHRFVEEYLLDLNATQAAIRAGYSKRTAKAQGSRLLTHPSVSDAICDAIEARSKRVEIDQDWVLNALVSIHESCIEDGSTHAALRSLELIGKHVHVQAFKEQKVVENTFSMKFDRAIEAVDQIIAEALEGQTNDVTHDSNALPMLTKVDLDRK